MEIKLEEAQEIYGDELRLYNIIDDIDTLGDAIKPETLDEYKAYFKAVNDFCTKRSLMYHCDGQRVFSKNVNQESAEIEGHGRTEEEVEKIIEENSKIDISGLLKASKAISEVGNFDSEVFNKAFAEAVKINKG